jgi:hypothetical protein
MAQPLDLVFRDASVSGACFSAFPVDANVSGACFSAFPVVLLLIAEAPCPGTASLIVSNSVSDMMVLS